MFGSTCIVSLGFTSPMGRGRIWREAANPGEGPCSLDRPIPPHPNPLPNGERESERSA
jgi:hypothetical protein